MKFCQRIADYAVESLIEEVELSPKPGLVDKLDNGSHEDLNLELMVRSAQTLKPTFYEIAYISLARSADQNLREGIAKVGRMGEKAMLEATGGTNTHKGAIWALGLLIASTATLEKEASYKTITATAGMIARFPDRNSNYLDTNGSEVQKQFGVQGARGEAQQNFPHITNIALPVLWNKRNEGKMESHARLDTLIAIMASLDDTCLLHRGGMKVLKNTKRRANEIIKLGGVSTDGGWKALQELDKYLVKKHASPGGSADLLAASLFLDKLSQNRIDAPSLDAVFSH